MSDSTDDAFYTLFELIGQISGVSLLSMRQFEMPGQMNRCIWTATTCVIEKRGFWYEPAGALAPFVYRVLEHLKPPPVVNGYLGSTVHGIRVYHCYMLPHRK